MKGDAAGTYSHDSLHWNRLMEMRLTDACLMEMDGYRAVMSIHGQFKPKVLVTELITN